MRTAYLLPAGALLAVVLGVPLAGTLVSGAPRMGEAFVDPDFGRAAANTLAFAAVSVTLELVLGMAFALVLHRSFRGRGLARAVALLPWALPTAVMAMSWRWIFNDTYGVAGDLLVRFGLAGTPPAWLGRPATAFFALVVADVWKTTPFVTLILLAGLQGIPRDLNEAMSLDGAGALRRFWRITLPLLRPAIALALVFRLIQALGLFDLVWVLTEGGPMDSTRTVALYIYDTIFRYDRPGYGAALTVLVAAGMFLLAAGAAAVVGGREART